MEMEEEAEEEEEEEEEVIEQPQPTKEVGHRTTSPY